MTISEPFQTNPMGVTKTAKVHAAAWKEMFDTYLRERATRIGERLRPFGAVAEQHRGSGETHDVSARHPLKGQ